ncbi:hypothetical protein [Novacetimonas sp. GS1]|uniref:hypothetical protein n=1 Tax=Novacetimonas sp. GS1 TaxID=3119990 RepID=UPI002FCCDC63
MKTRHRGRLPVSIQKYLLEHFVADPPVWGAAELVGVNRNTATLYYRKLREIIAEQIAHGAPVSPGCIYYCMMQNSELQQNRQRPSHGRLPIISNSVTYNLYPVTIPARFACCFSPGTSRPEPGQGRHGKGFIIAA